MECIALLKVTKDKTLIVYIAQRFSLSYMHTRGDNDNNMEIVMEIYGHEG
jgi:hypothetical protein